MDSNAKIVIIGMGEVGSSCAFSFLLQNVAIEIVLIDINKEKAIGEAMDLNHATSLLQPTTIYAGEYSDCKNADIVIITAGVKQKPGQNRLDLLSANNVLMKDIINNIMPHIAKKTILLIVSNPVDILTYQALKFSGLPSHHVIGSGTVLDTARLKFLLSQYLHIDPLSLHACIAGEHGDSEIPLWEESSIGGMKLIDYLKIVDPNNYKKKLEEVHKEVRDAAYQMIKTKGATCYGIAVSVTKIVRSILRDEKAVLFVSSYIKKYNGVTDVCLSLPTLVNREGVAGILPIILAEEEKKKFQESANKMKEVIQQIKN